MSNHGHDIDVLNDLVATTYDSILGYRDAAEDANSGQYGAMFTQCANEREHVLTALKNEVRTLGGDPEDEGTTAGKVHRKFQDLRHAVTGKDDTAIVKTVEQGEDYIKDKFERAMRDDRLTPSVKSAITAQYQSVKAGHDRMSNLKHSLGAR